MQRLMQRVMRRVIWRPSKNRLWPNSTVHLVRQSCSPLAPITEKLQRGHPLCLPTEATEATEVHSSAVTARCRVRALHQPDPSTWNRALFSFSIVNNLTWSCAVLGASPHLPSVYTDLGIQAHAHAHIIHRLFDSCTSHQLPSFVFRWSVHRI